MTAILLTLAVTALLQQAPTGPVTPPPAEVDWRTADSSRFRGITFGDGAGVRATVEAPPAEPAPAATTWEAANHACRGQTWRRPSESVRACTERLVATDALSQPLPQGREPAEPRCRRETVRSEDGTGFSVSVRCQETTIAPARPG